MPKPTRKSTAAKTQTLPVRAKVPLRDQWDLTQLYPSDAAWENDFDKWTAQIDRYAAFRDTLGQSPQTLAELFRFDADFSRLGDRLGSYAGLKSAADQADSACQRMKGRLHHVAVKAAEAASFVRPELLALPED